MSKKFHIYEISKNKYKIMLGDEVIKIFSFAQTSYAKKDLINYYNSFFDSDHITLDIKKLVNYDCEFISDCMQIKDLFLKTLDEVKDSVFEIINNLDIDKYADTKKKTKNSFLFTKESITELLYLSYYMKVYVLFISLNDTIVQKYARNLFNDMIVHTKSIDIFDKLFSFTKVKLNPIYMYNQPVWVFLKLNGEDFDTIVNTLFNFLIESALTIFQPNRSNIVGFLSVIIDKNIGWLLHQKFTENVVIDSMLINDDDNFIDISYKTNFIASCSYDNTIDRIIKFVQLYLQEKRIDIKKFESRVSELYIGQLQNLFIIPILSKVLNIDYNHFIFISKDRTIIFYLQVYLYCLFENYIHEFKYLPDILQIGLYKTNISSKTGGYKLRDEKILAANFSYYGLNNKHRILIKLINEIYLELSKKIRLRNIFHDGIKICNYDNNYIFELIKVYSEFFTYEDSPLFTKLKKQAIKDISSITL